MGCVNSSDRKADGSAEKGGEWSSGLAAGEGSDGAWSSESTGAKPEALGAYRLLGTLAAELTFTLVKAVHIPTKQSCTIKIQRKQSILQFQRQRRQLLQHDHPHILRVLEVLQDADYVYVVWESFCGLLQDFLEDLQSEDTVATGMAQVFRALAYCHRHGVIHGTISPRSIVLKSPPNKGPLRLKLTGFGPLDDVSEVSSAPMQTAKGDIFSCGVTLYEWLCGRTPGITLFSEAKWMQRSNESIGLASSLMSPFPEDRPSAAESLSALWLRQRTPFPDRKAAEKCVRCLRRRCRKGAAQEALLRFIATRLLSVSERCNEAFRAFDFTCKGQLTGDDFLHVLLTVLPKDDAFSTAEHLTACFSRTPVTYTDFIIACVGERTLLSLANLKSVFRCLKVDSQGRTSTAEVRKLLRLKSGKDLLKTTDPEARIDFAAFSTLATAASN